MHLNYVADLFLARDPDFFTALDYAGLVKTYQFRNLYSLIGNQLEKLLDHPLLEVMAVKRRVEDPLGFAWCKEHVSALAPTVGSAIPITSCTNCWNSKPLRFRHC